MRFLGRALAALFAVGVFLVAVAWFLPREVTVTREIVIAAPPARVFAHLNSMQKMAEWSPWTRLDPAMRTSFAGPPEGTGNRMTWSSDDPAVGSGSQEIIVSEPDERVETSLQFGDMGAGDGLAGAQARGRRHPCHLGHPRRRGRLAVGATWASPWTAGSAPTSRRGSRR